MRLCFSLSSIERSFNSIATLRPLTKEPKRHAHQHSPSLYVRQPTTSKPLQPAFASRPSKRERVSSIYDPQMGKTLARKLESQYVFNK